jgi:hypothetical protein
MSRLAGEKEAHRSKGTEMPVSRHPINVAVLDDYQGVAMSIVDWSKVSDRANIAVFQDHLGNQDAVCHKGSQLPRAIASLFSMVGPIKGCIRRTPK